MTTTPHILAICGSIRRESSNLQLIHAIIKLYESQLKLSVYDGLGRLAAFNPDIEEHLAPASVVDLRYQLKAAQAVLICTPEYAAGVPGVLKNAIDWTVSSAEFYGKPTAVVTASTMGDRGHTSLLQTLELIGCKLHTECQLLIPALHTKLGHDGCISDGDLLKKVDTLMHRLIALTEQE